MDRGIDGLRDRRKDGFEGLRVRGIDGLRDGRKDGLRDR